MTTATIEHLTEFVSSTGGLRVDEASHTIRGVKVLGTSSSNGRRYLRSAIEGAVARYVEAHVFVDHASPKQARSYRDRIATIVNPRARGDGIYADLRYNPRHPLAEQLAWDAEHSPTSVGLSHNVMAATKREGNSVVVESIEKVISVDLVAEPATTAGLFESHDRTTQRWREATAEQFSQRITDTEPTGAAKLKQFTDAITE